MNADRRKDHVDKVSYEVFEIVMDRLEKEWFDLVRLGCSGFASSMLISFVDQEHSEA